MKLPHTKILLLLLLVGVSPSCKESFLDVTPKDGSITDLSFWKTADDFIGVINSAYHDMEYNEASGEQWLAIPNLILQEVEQSGGPAELPAFFQPNRHGQWWATFYGMVHKTNLVLANAGNGKLKEDERARVEAEAKFLRGFAYFNLTRAFGGVPLVLRPKTATDAKEDARATEAQSWDQVIEDLTAAEGLPVQWDADNTGRATRGAALAYLANAYMYKKDWPRALLAAEALEAVANGGRYRLLDNYRDAFSEKKENGPESLFEVQYRPGYDNGWGKPSNIHYLGAYTSPGGAGDEFAVGGGWGTYVLSKSLGNSFEPGDRRRFAYQNPAGETVYPAVLGPGESYRGEAFPTGMAYTLQPGTGSTGFYATKYWLGRVNDADGGNYGGGQNLPQMRYAEAVLNYAEILSALGRTPEAYAQLNRVRRRAGLADQPLADPAQCLRDINTERRHELFFEPNLYFHFVRTGYITAFLRDTYGKTFQEAWYRWPLPQSEIDNNPALQGFQNPGY